MTSLQLGYARVSTDPQSLDQQLDALIAAGVDEARIYGDKGAVLALTAPA